MNFSDWMAHQGLSESSIRKYAGAIEGPLSNWAVEAGLISGRLDTITSRSAFSGIDDLLRRLPIFLERNTRGHHMYSSALVKFAEYLEQNVGSDLEGDIDAIVEDVSLTPTERSTLVKARVGQGAFRQRLIAYWKSCAVTGCIETSLLVASHIKPWRSSTNTERLDVFNGLLLTPNLDRAFDAGLVSFDESGQIMISALLSDPGKLGISLDMRVTLRPGHKVFMDHHRSDVFRTG